MRTESASSIRGTRAGVNRGGPITRKLPAEGTSIRRVYDVLYKNRGLLVPLDDLRALRRELNTRTRNNFSSMTSQLKNFYGCDIRRDTSNPIMGSMSLVGEWVGKVYIDYTAPAVERAGGKSSTYPTRTESP